jgi:protein phosphatase
MNHEPQASGVRLKIDFAQASDPGRDPNKQVNEDSCGYAETRFGHLAVLCDGMGGHYGGKEASRTAITTIFEMFEQMPLSVPPGQALKNAIEEAGRRVYLLGGPPDNRTRPGSTVVAMLLHDRGLDVAHVGDSRAYIIRSNQIYPLTRDHSMVQGMIDAGMLTEESAMGHPDSNKITRALGMRPDVDVEVRPESMEVFAGDVLLQSSDGLTDLALGRDILGGARQALASGGVEHACHMLVKMANDRGGHDNITVQMLRVLEVGSKATNTIPERPANPPTAPMSAVPSMSYPAAQAAHTAYTPQPAQAQGQAQPRNGWAPVVPAGAPGGSAAQAHAPVAPTPPDYEGAHRPTLNETPLSPVAWSPQGQNPQPQTGLGGYRLDAGAGGLPLPPSSVRAPTAPGSVAPTAAGVTAYTPAPSPSQGGFAPQQGGFAPQQGGFAPQQGGFAPQQGGFAPQQGGFAPQAAAPLAAPIPASRGGIVYVIVGLSAVIAVLILVIVWALWLRG